MYPLRTGMIPPQLPGSPSYLRPGTPALAVFLRDLGYTTGEFGKNHLGDHTAALPTAHGFQEYWGWLYHLDFDQRAYLEGTSDKSARDVFFYYSGATPSAVRYKNWKMYYTMAPGGATGWFLPLVNYHWTLVANIKRDPFEQAVSFGDAKSAMELGGTLGSPTTAYLYDWNMLPIGQLLWEKELYTFKEFPPLQAAETYNLDGILKQMEEHKGDD